MLNYTLIPEHMRHGLQLYVEYGVLPGDFLMAVLTNDLRGAFEKADRINKPLIEEWTMFMYNEMPSGAQGSHENVIKYSNQQNDPATRNHFFAIFNEDGSTKPAGELKDTWHHVGQPEEELDTLRKKATQRVLCSTHPYDLHPKTSECKHIIENETVDTLMD